MRLKKIKHFITRNFKKLKFEIEFWWDHNVFRDTYDYVTYSFWKKLGRGIAHFKIGWKAFDFDGFYIHELVLFKLKRMQKLFIEEGYHSEECSNYKPKMKSLALAIKILDRYVNRDNHNYYHKFYDLYNKKWKPPGLFDNAVPADVDKDGYVRTWKTIRNMDEQESKEFREAYAKDDRREQRDIELVYKLIIKYHGYWWD